MFITLEGIEGAGKTTQVKTIVDFLADHGHPCIVTREPGGTRIGEMIRAILLNPQNHALEPITELLLYTADRAQHIREVILPHLTAGRTVFCDRFFDATLVYQGFARGLNRELILQLHRTVNKNLTPDITILLDLPPKIGLSRAWQQVASGDRSQSETRFEKERLAFHERIRAGYLQLARSDAKRFRVIDAGRDIEKVGRDIRDALTRFIRNYSEHA
jgi:dTMP kinase